MTNSIIPVFSRDRFITCLWKMNFVAVLFQRNAASSPAVWRLGKIGFLLLIISFALVSHSFGADLTVNSYTVLAPGTYNYDNLTVNDTLVCQGDTNTGTGVIINCVNLTVNAGGAITADSQGYPKGQGPGAPPASSTSAGGSYGGWGGPGGVSSQPASPPYGSVNAPVSLGSGAGTVTSKGTGGGAIKLVVSNEARIDGAVSANGEDSTYVGASGGSVYIITKTLSGSGQIRAIGGKSYSGNTVACGGGGRIAIYYEANNFTGTINARRALGQWYGNPSCGTIFMKSFAQQNGDLIIDANGYENNFYYTTITGNYTFDTVVLKNLGHAEFDTASTIGVTNFLGQTASTTVRCKGRLVNNSTLTVYENAVVEIDTATTLYNLVIKPNGKVSHTLHNNTTDSLEAKYKLDLTINNDLTIEQGGVIDVNGKGFAAGCGPGKPVAASAGGSYGGKGGKWTPGTYTDTPGEPYGSETMPTDLGSGGKNSAAGGAVILYVLGTLKNDGLITSEGAVADCAGSGGSIYIRTPNFSGNPSGKISVRGGRWGYAFGGGGRIAVYYDVNTYNGSFDTSAGGGDAQPGTKYLQEMTFYLPPRLTLIDNPAYSSAITGKRPSFKWTAPTDQENDNLHFDIEVTQDSSFALTPTISASSSSSTTGFQYSTDNGLTWTDFPSVGVSSNANPAIKIRYTVQQDLWSGSWYWHVRAKDVDGNGVWSELGFLPSIIADLLVRIDTPDDSSAVYDEKIKVEGSVENSVSQTVTINGVAQNLTVTDNKFSIEVALEIGKNTVMVTGYGTLSNYISDTITIYRLKVPSSSEEVTVTGDAGEVRLDDYDGDKENDSRMEFDKDLFDREVKIVFKRVNEDIQVYEIKIDNQETYKFKKKVKLVLSYKNQKVDSKYEDKLRIFYWDGIKWQLIGGVVNKEKRVVSCYTQHASKFAVMLIPDDKTKTIVVSPVVFTPNKDGINDFVLFNCMGAGKLEIKIYDTLGTIVRYIVDSDVTSGNSVVWDGHDENGRLLETGLYVYNVYLSGRTVSSGTLMSAK